MTTKTMCGHERLLRLADILHNLPAENLDLAQWVTRTDSPFSKQLGGCGYVACAVGHAMADPVLNAQGLRGDAVGLDRLGPPRWIPRVNSERGSFAGWSAVTEFFGVRYAEATWLFDPTAYDMEGPTPEIVADRIRAFVVQKQGDLT